MNKEDLEVVEIYPHILVYKNLFKDISKSYNVLTDSLLETEDRVFSPWTKWSIFGEYISPIVPYFSLLDSWGNLKKINPKTKIQEEQKKFAIEMMENFYLATEDYIKRYNIDVDLSETSTDEDGNLVQTWRWWGGSIAKYDISTSDNEIGMRYHSDYMREEASAPGYKFVITCTMYFNDDYDGGEIDFAMGKKLVKYKPEAGDVLVFPSGHPDYLVENGEPYLHGVMPAYNKNKFLVRMYWQKYQKGTDEWYKKEQEFGKEVWASMQEDIKQEFRLKNVQRDKIENGIRLS